jgi:Domain of unknown function (DUF4132)
MPKNLTSKRTNTNTNKLLQYPPTCSIDLDPSDFYQENWSDRQPLLRPTPPVFDLQKCLQRLQLVTGGNHLSYSWDWSKAEIGVSISPAEAEFWLTAMKAMIRTDVTDFNWRKVDPQKIQQQLAQQIFTGNVSLQEFFLSEEQLKDLFSVFTEEAFIPWQNLFGVASLVKFDIQIRDLIPGFKKYILPYLTHLEFVELQQAIEKEIDQIHFPDSVHNLPHGVFFLAANVGLGHKLEKIFADLPDNYYYSGPGLYGHPVGYDPRDLTFCFVDEQILCTQMQRLQLYLYKPQHIRQWLARTGYQGLKHIRDGIMQVRDKEGAAQLITMFSLVKAPQIAPYMLELTLFSTAPYIAIKWLDQYVEHGIAGLIEMAANYDPEKQQQDKLPTAALKYLRTQKRKGHSQYIQACLADHPIEIRDQITKLVLEHKVTSKIEFTVTNFPPGLQASLPEATKTSKWLAVEDLPPITSGNYCLSDDQMRSVLTALAQSKTEPHPAIEQLKQVCDAHSLETFAWSLFQRWLLMDAPSKEIWALQAVGWLGRDQSAIDLTILVKDWAADKFAARAGVGLECLRAIGTDTALLQLSNIVYKTRFKGIKERAKKCLESIAAQRQLSRDQLEDRMIPDCDLDDQGNRVFDYGLRQFHFVFSDDLQPKLRDEKGKILKALPRTNDKDDPEKVAIATAEWQQFKQEVKDVVKIQPARLELSMRFDRRWSFHDFTTLLVQHPLMRHFFQRLLWTSYDSQGKVLEHFRITEDFTYSDVDDNLYQLTADMQIGLLHPARISPAVRSQWNELLVDYEITQPFTQVNRSAYYLDSDDLKKFEITKFRAKMVLIITLSGLLRKMGWHGTLPSEESRYTIHTRYFPTANVTAVIGDHDDRQLTDGCCFLTGQHLELMDYPVYAHSSHHQYLIPLHSIDIIVISEVLNDLTFCVDHGYTR